MKILAIVLAGLLALAGAALVAFGVGMVFEPAGLIVGGVEALATAYGIGYVLAKTTKAKP